MTIERPWASSARARAETSKADSVPMVPMRAATWRVEMVIAGASGRSGQQRADGEGDVGRPLGEPTHVPRVPGVTVRDERLDAIAGCRQTELLLGPDAVEH